GMRCQIVADSGAYAGFGGALAMGPTRMMAQGVYRIPRISYECAVALTNTTPMGAFRGAGRPEAAAMLERIIDIAAAELGIDPAEIRRRNFLRPDEFPYKTVMRTEYDSGDYDAALTEALRVAGYDELRREQSERSARGDRGVLGVGVSGVVEVERGDDARGQSRRRRRDGRRRGRGRSPRERPHVGAARAARTDPGDIQLRASGCDVPVWYARRRRGGRSRHRPGHAGPARRGGRLR